MENMSVHIGDTVVLRGQKTIQIVADCVATLDGGMYIKTDLLDVWTDVSLFTKVDLSCEPQPTPAPGNFIIIDQVEKDLRARAEFGKQKYGTYLMTNNGRDPLWDAYQEALDLCMYLRQAIMERDRNMR